MTLNPDSNKRHPTASGCEGDECAVLGNIDWADMQAKQQKRRNPEDKSMKMNNTIAMREIQIASEEIRAAGILDDLKAKKMAAVITKLFGRIIGLKNDIDETARTLQQEADDSGEVKAILRGIPVLKDVLELGMQLRGMSRKIPRRDDVSAQIVNVLTASNA